MVMATNLIHLLLRQMIKGNPASAVRSESTDTFMSRCVQLARKGAGWVAPNPMVGAVLVHEGRVIGEGYHEKYGQPHAEPNCINQAIRNGHAEKLKESVLYVSLEPCAHFGKTPPCADLIIRHQIPKVVIGCRDPFPEVDGKGIEKLKAAGVEVQLAVDEDECRELNKRFFTFHTRHRPYIILKWAETADGFIAPTQAGLDHRLQISNEYSNRLVHQWRSEEASILVGTQTALSDNPALTTRLWPGNSPVRLVIDMDLKLPESLRLFDHSVRTIVFNTKKHSEEPNLLYYQITEDTSVVDQLVHALHQLKLQSVLVEGGARLLQSFIDAGLWDEARIIRNTALNIEQGLLAPELSNEIHRETTTLLSDTIETFYRHE